MTPNLYSSRRDLLDDTTSIDYVHGEDKLSSFGGGEPTWDAYLKGFSSTAKDRDSGLVYDLWNNFPSRFILVSIY